MINTAAYSYSATCYPEDVEKLISTMEAFVGIGCISGPVVGSFVYNLVGYSMTFYIFGALMLPTAILVPCLLKKPTT